MFNLIVLIILFVVCNSIADKRSIINDLTHTKLIEGNKTLITCQISDGQSASVNWYFNENKLENNANIYSNNFEGNSILVIKSFLIENSGDYKCRASLDNREYDEKKIRLILNSKLSIFNKDSL